MAEPIVFIASPRTGSYSICEGLGIPHSHEPWYDREPGKYTFSVVRNPWEQARSWYLLSKLDRFVAFETWCVSGCPADGRWAATVAFAYRLIWAGDTPWWAKCPPTEQLARAGHICEDILRLEDIADWWPILCSNPLPHLGATTKNKPEYTEKAAHAIAIQQAELIERFNYKPPMP